LQDAENSPNPDPEFIKGLEEKLAVLEVQSEVNRPDVRWHFRNGLGECPEPRYTLPAPSSLFVKGTCPNQFTGTSPRKSGGMRGILTF
jgi:hypothetical protein